MRNKQYVSKKAVKNDAKAMAAVELLVELQQTKVQADVGLRRSQCLLDNPVVIDGYSDVLLDFKYVEANKFVN